MTVATEARKPVRLRKPLYMAAPLDSVALAAEAEALLSQHWPLSAQELLNLAGRDRPDLATMLLLRACYRDGNGDFMRKVDALPRDLAPLETPIRLLIVPAFLFAEHPELAIDGALIKDIADRLGAETEIVPIDSRGISAANGRLIADHLCRQSDKPTWMLSISKGTSDARAALHQLGGWPARLKGWVDVSGIFSGTPIADWWTEEMVRRWLLKLFFGFTNLPFDTLLEMRRDAPLWQSPVVPPSTDRLIHILGFPPPWCVEPRMERNYRRLLATDGPNDGLTPLAGAFDYPGRLVPVWGADHFMRLPDLASLIYRTIHMIAAVEAGTFAET
ncbi:MAG TPA: hypothetical protein VM659_03290 [Dongiaceae bacterium]|nr:hypothetical protein [Dongiaceae bacterium]